MILESLAFRAMMMPPGFYTPKHILMMALIFVVGVVVRLVTREK